MGTPKGSFTKIEDVDFQDRENYSYELRDGQPHKLTFPKDYFLEVAKGDVTDHTLVTFNGHNPTVGTSTETLWEEGGSYTFPANDNTMTVSSDDTNDDSGGTGLLTGRAIGLDINYADLEEDFTLDGQTGVTLTKAFFRINSIIGLTAGSGGKNAGNIFIGTGTVTTGKPANVFGHMGVGNNVAHSGIFTVGANKNGYLVNLIATGTGNKTAEISAVVSVDAGLFRLAVELDLDNGPVAIVRAIPFRKLVAKSDIEFRCIAGQTADVKAIITLLIEDV